MFSLRDFPVTVRRKNSEIESVYLGEISDIKLFCCKLWNLFPGAELERFVDSDFPQWNESWITTGFEFDIKRLGNIEGIIEPEPLVSKRQINIDENYFTYCRFGQHLRIWPSKMEKRGNRVRRVKPWARQCGWGRAKANSVKKDQYHKLKSMFHILYH